MSFLAQLFGSQVAQPTTTQSTTAPNTQQQQQPGTGNPGAGQPGNIPPSAATNSNAKADGTTAPNGVVPAGGESGSPLDQFADLWKIEPKKDGENPEEFSLNVDPKKLMEAAGKTDFSRALNQELLTKIAGGGEDAVKAMVTAMNSMAQATYGQSTLTTAKIVEQALEAQRSQFMQQLPGMIKQHQLGDSLASENPLFSNPAVQPIMDALKAQLTVKHPNATAAELTSMAKNYVAALGTSFAPKPPSQGDASKSKEYDWSNFLNT